MEANTTIQTTSLQSEAGVILGAPIEAVPAVVRSAEESSITEASGEITITEAATTTKEMSSREISTSEIAAVSAHIEISSTAEVSKTEVVETTTVVTTTQEQTEASQKQTEVTAKVLDRAVLDSSISDSLERVVTSPATIPPDATSLRTNVESAMAHLVSVVENMVVEVNQLKACARSMVTTELETRVSRLRSETKGTEARLRTLMDWRTLRAGANLRDRIDLRWRQARDQIEALEVQIKASDNEIAELKQLLLSFPARSLAEEIREIRDQVGRRDRAVEDYRMYESRVNEGHGRLNFHEERIETLQAWSAETTSTVTNIKADASRIMEKVDALESRVQQNHQRLSEHDAQLSMLAREADPIVALRGELTEVQKIHQSHDALIHDLDASHGNKIAELVNLHQRQSEELKLLQTHVQSIQAPPLSAPAPKVDLSHVEARIAELESSVEGRFSKFDKLESSVTERFSRLEKLESSVTERFSTFESTMISDRRAELAVLDRSAETVEANKAVDNLNERLQALEQRLDQLSQTISADVGTMKAQVAGISHTDALTQMEHRLKGLENKQQQVTVSSPMSAIGTNQALPPIVTRHITHVFQMSEPLGYTSVPAVEITPVRTPAYIASAADATPMAGTPGKILIDANTPTDVYVKVEPTDILHTPTLTGPAAPSTMSTADKFHMAEATPMTPIMIQKHMSPLIAHSSHDGSPMVRPMADSPLKKLASQTQSSSAQSSSIHQYSH
eukprot:Protomagalhaensia_sp_Gyna_25__5495@NODE_731_length_2744_cov_45_854713_g570_i0_p1_GENE_NODE_731_length_2744_cov_45_854713_g570_i0NODE_731_length_2744_cov_45_854713_g570_i0_p1_ORF_typecomplete_len865_score179_00DUF16/PF01519_16/5_2e03DUF16/PF01519_16/5_1e03DUF16/PF01519_16/7_9e02DUF16/PF01519_16/3_7e02DUF16/PF01519_16/0_0018DUF16/PF01519_16/0_27Sugarporin_N/PF11471_8/3_7e03Sugarporin_N/PF11471_8/0_6Sugarporin_N/PF11471_8/5_7Sugarporin_N/PF11471_8/0_17Sugarporin_N/PF11471_8/2_3e02DUF4164/PF13747_6/